MKRLFQVLFWISNLFVLFMGNWAFSSDATDAAKVFRRITGTTYSPRDPLILSAAERVRSGGLIEAARMATEQPNFYQVTLRNWSAPLSSREETPYQPFNDFQAMIIGVTRDGTDARELLTGDFTYIVEGSPAQPSPLNNDHYSQAESRRMDLKSSLRKVVPQRPAAERYEAAGVLTSRAWGEAHLIAGTNRRAVEYSLKQFLCRDKENWKDRGVADFRVRRDVNRAPGDNPSDYQNRCRSCHGIMDGMGGAFSRYDFREGQLAYLGSDRIANKMNQNGMMYPDGWVTVDDSWINLATRNHNESFGWRGRLEGHGLREFGAMLADSDAFGKCMTYRVFKEVCRREPTDSDQMKINGWSSEFQSSGYRLKALFETIAADRACFE